MNKLGIRAHDIGKFSASDLSNEVSSLGFDGVQLVFEKALLTEVDFTHLDSIKNAFIKPYIMMLGAYFNPVHPDKHEVEKGIQKFENHLKIAKELQCLYVGTETGSYQGSPWTYHPLNHTYEAMHEAIAVFKRLVQTAKKYDAYVAIEGAYQHVAYSPERLKLMVDHINSPRLKVTVDLFNYLNPTNYQDHMLIFEKALELFDKDIVIFHLKDFIYEDGKLIQVGLGQGLMDYKTIIKRIKETHPEAYLIFEGVTGDDIKSSYQFIKSLLEKDV